MGKVDAFSINGLRLGFHSADHPPPHFHVKKLGAWEIRVFIETTQEKSLDFNVIFSRKEPTSAEKTKIAALVVAYQEELLQEWETKVAYRSGF
ncbi:DUF4160 domain-containing protein [Oscillatoria sp. HE19RPO]|uniref:DUF4160 domain-containing protein n=1 Tax=Oscillatoria sp. HE19RPO TaxID=2954806 RepID=UPI0020C58AFA|nr:DUF4160 domain-containing protein [Oscillatoria sp. HE19RPO]